MSRRLYLYSDLAGSLGWYPDAAAFRREHKAATYAIRVAAGAEVLPPSGYRLIGRGLAHEGCERIPTMRNLVAGLTPAPKKRK